METTVIMKGASLCALTITQPSKHTHLREITAPWYTDWVCKLLSQYGGFILIITVSTNPTNQFAYWNAVYTPQGRQIHSTQVFNHHPQSSRWITCFCMNHMDVWEVTQYSLCVTVININYIRCSVWCEWLIHTVEQRQREKEEVKPPFSCSCRVNCGWRRVHHECVHTCPRLISLKKICEFF